MSSYDLTWIDSLPLEELNKTNRWGRSALTYAVLLDDTLKVQKLIQRGVEQDRPDQWGCTPVSYASVISSPFMKNQFSGKKLATVDTARSRTVYEQQLRLADTILSQLKQMTPDSKPTIPQLSGFDPNTPVKLFSRSYATMVSIMATKRYVEPLQHLVKQGACINGKNHVGEYSLLAADWDDTAMHQYLLDLGATPNPITSGGRHISLLFCEKGDTLLVDALYQRGMRLDSKTLLEAIDEGDRGMVRYLSSKVPLDSSKYILDDIAALNDSVILTNLLSDEMIDSTLIRDICRTKNVQSISWIMQRGTHLTPDDRINVARAPLEDTLIIQQILNGITEDSIPGKMLQRTMYNHNYIFADQIIKKLGKIPDSLDGITYFPASQGDTLVINRLLSQGASLNYPERYSGELPLAAAAAWKQSGVFIGWLINKGAEIDGRHKKYGHTALFQAVDSKNWDVVDTLIARGADPMVASSDGRTVYFNYKILSEGERFTSFLESVRKEYPNRSAFELSGFNLVDTAGYSLFYYACNYGDRTTLQHLFTIGESSSRPTKKELKQGFIKAVASWRDDNVRLLLQKGAPITGIDGEGNTILHHAIDRNDTSLFLMGLKERTLLNHKNDSGFTPLYIAAQKGSRRERDRWYLDSLLAYGANPSIASKSGRTPLCFIDSEEYLQKLLKHGASVDVLYNDGGSLLIDVIKGYHRKEYALEVIRRTKSPNRGIHYGRSALAVAVEDKKSDYIRALVKRGASLHHPSVLYQAIETNDTAMTNLLFSLGARPGKSWERSGRLLLEVKDMAIFNRLLSMGINPNVRDNKGRTVLMKLQKDTTKAAQLIAKGANIHLKDINGDNALSYAASSGDTLLFNWLLRRGARPKDAADILFLAVKGREQAIIDTLLARGFSVDSPVKSGFSPLFYAIKNNRGDDILRTCISNTRDINRKIDGMTALMIAVVTFEVKSLAQLLEAGADPTIATDKNRRTALHYAAITQHFQAEESERTGVLLEKGAPVDALDKDGRTPLIWALKVRNKNSAILLVKHGAERTIKDRFGKCALDYLSENDNASDYGL